ncbi:MAG: hypothetical protein ACKKMV_01845 [Candidatus Nealsonbacteria bacterium]
MLFKNSYYVHSKCIGKNYSSLFWIWERLKDLIIFLNDNLLGIIFLFFFLFFIIIWILNYITLIRYKREYRNNDKKFTTKRCIEDGDERGRNHVYLISEKDNTYQRIEDRYTLNKLGYGSASRRDELCFSIQDYKVKKRIKIYNVLIDIKDILKLKNDLDS